MKRMMSAALALAAILGPAQAKDDVVFVETAAVKDKPAITLDPAKAYLLVRSNAPIPLQLMRISSPEDQARYDELKARAFAEAREKYEKKKASYDKAKAAYDKSPKGAAKPVLPSKPHEPTESNFEFTPFGMLSRATVGPLNRFAKAEGESTYLQELTPGEYRIYGIFEFVPNIGTLGACFCMGSVAFEVKAGEITDLGHFVSREFSERVKSDSAQPPPSDLWIYQPPANGRATDSRISAFPVRAAKLRPVGKLPNYLGITINRFPAIEGVMRYERDRIVDLTVAQ